MVEISNVWFSKVYSKLDENMAVKNYYLLICFDHFFIDSLDPHYHSESEFSSQGIKILLISLRSRKLRK